MESSTCKPGGRKKNLFDEMKDTINRMGKELCQLQNTNNQLQEYFKCLEKDEGFSYNGKKNF